jgi:membrane-associated protease RseP (regulator of RpoE activity)
LLTFLTTTAMGSRLAYNFSHDLPAFDLDHDLMVFVEVLREPSLLWAGLPYSIALMTILLAHEFGHWLACGWYGIRASLPYFLPAPTFVGTFGAFIRFRSAVGNRRELFDVGIAGPLAGFLFTIPVLGIGLALSKVTPAIAEHGEVQFGMPLLMRLGMMFLFPGAHPEDISLHPMARAAWVGLLATALNLMPAGQFDGGHLVYAAFGDRHKWVSLGVVAVLALLGFVYWPWWIWAVVFLVLGRRHFAVVDEGGLGGGRRLLLVLALLVFALSFTPVPVLYNSEQAGLD